MSLLKKKKCSRRGSNPRPSHCFSTLGGYMAGTAYKYDALTDCATGAGQGRRIKIRNVSVN